MCVIKNNHRRTGQFRSESGQILELGPAVWILVVFFVFPLIVLLSMLVSYGSIMLLNNLQVHEASLLPYSDAQNPGGAVILSIPTDWQNAGVGKFVNLNSTPQTAVSYKNGEMGVTGVQDKIVVVSTTCSLKPWLSQSSWLSVPGLSAPVAFTITSERPVENPDNAP